MDTRRCALFLIKCVQGFAAISWRWMTWKCNFQCLSLVLLAKAFFLSHASLYGCALEITFFCNSPVHVFVWFLCRHLHERYLLLHVFDCHIGAYFREHPQYLTNTRHSWCATLSWNPLAPPPPKKKQKKTGLVPKQRLFLDTMPSPW